MQISSLFSFHLIPKLMKHHLLLLKSWCSSVWYHFRCIDHWGLVSLMFEVFYRYLYCTLIVRMLSACVLAIWVFLYIVVVFLATCSIVLTVKRYLYTGVDVISDFFSYHVWLWWFLWWSGHLVIWLRDMFLAFYC